LTACAAFSTAWTCEEDEEGESEVAILMIGVVEDLKMIEMVCRSETQSGVGVRCGCEFLQERNRKRKRRGWREVLYTVILNAIGE
jgi:hypothetical protein